MAYNCKLSMDTHYILSANTALAVEKYRSFKNIVDFPVLVLHSKIRCILTTCESLNVNIQSAAKIAVLIMAPKKYQEIGQRCK
jgi:hypothetical protein